MSAATAYGALAHELHQSCARSGFVSALVCTERGLLVAQAGDEPLAESLAALTGLFDDVLARARDALAMTALDELTLHDERRSRLVVRPILACDDVRFFLVIRVAPALPWRRECRRLCLALSHPLAALGRTEQT